MATAPEADSVPLAHVQPPGFFTRRLTDADPAVADRQWGTPRRPPKDHCAEMRQQMGR